MQYWVHIGGGSIFWILEGVWASASEARVQSFRALGILQMIEFPEGTFRTAEPELRHVSAFSYEFEKMRRARKHALNVVGSRDKDWTSNFCAK